MLDSHRLFQPGQIYKLQSTGPAQDCSSTWDLDGLESEPELSQPRGKKRKANGHGGRAAAHVDIEDKQ
jgi:hypothetical protein